MSVTAGYSGTPLVKKLGIKEGAACLFINTPDHYYQLLEGLPPHKKATMDKASPESVDFIHAFVQYEEDLLSLWDTAKSKLKKDGMFWVSWPKGKSKLEKDLDENIIRHVGLTGGLVDVKVCAIDEDWSGLKFMYRKKDR